MSGAIAELQQLPVQAPNGILELAALAQVIEGQQERVYEAAIVISSSGPRMRNLHRLEKCPWQAPEIQAAGAFVTIQENQYPCLCMYRTGDKLSKVAILQTRLRRVLPLSVDQAKAALVVVFLRAAAKEAKDEDITRSALRADLLDQPPRVYCCGAVVVELLHDLGAGTPSEARQLLAIFDAIHRRRGSPVVQRADHAIDIAPDEHLLVSLTGNGGACVSQVLAHELRLAAILRHVLYHEAFSEVVTVLQALCSHAVSHGRAYAASADTTPRKGGAPLADAAQRRNDREAWYTWKLA
mmetsp:Transcript_50075/g.140822  ORF Transcript_50075/g.140822 Transcript_50075/m.140822 type:complete len:297 (+) Transcript_50075:277-1167(+)